MTTSNNAPSVPVATLGTPRIGPRRELKLALESFWAGQSDEKALLETAAALRAANWARQKALGASIIPSNDFSLYDQVLDTSAMVGAIPAVYGWNGGPVSLATYFAMARGSQGDAPRDSCGHAHHHGHGMPAQEMTKWFDTNYHYMVPELTREQRLTSAIDARVRGHRLRSHPFPATGSGILQIRDRLSSGGCRLSAPNRP